MGIGVCGGNLTTNPLTRQDHCCWLLGEVCPALQELDGEPACGFMIQSGGDWDAVYADPGYQTWVQPVLESRGVAPCGDYPVVGQTCGDCGLTGDANIEALSETSAGVVDVRISGMKTGVKMAYRRELEDQLEAWAIAHP